MNSILVVDDSAFARTIMKDMLSSAGYRIAGEASDGQQAYEKYKKLRPDLTVMDIIMNRVDGIRSLEMILEYDPNATVVMCSAMGQEFYVMEALSLGAKEFIVKPFVWKEALGVVSRVLQK